ncbi:hypothetical protein, partial [Candidatus Thiosymbion oneisti]|uniref:hypothetical protein n=1 Tax=Candidatus Thiosymbion oneisti TaxID=589554 RepID=UPI001C407110
YQRRWPGIRALRFHPRRGDGAFPWPQSRCWKRMHRQIQSGGGPVFQANAVVTSGSADSGWS